MRADGVAARCTWVLLPLLLSACAATQEDLRDLRALIDRQAAESKEQRRRQEAFEEEMREGLTIALCRPEVRQLLDDVAAECGKAPLPPPAGAAPLASMPTPALPPVCRTPQIQPAVRAADPERKGRFIKFMYHLAHEVFYVPPRGTALMTSRMERLQRLINRRPLQSTRYLIVAHPARRARFDQTESEERAKLIMSFLLRADIPEERIILWNYAFPVSLEEIPNPADRPLLGECQDLDCSVWLFRADC